MGVQQVSVNAAFAYPAMAGNISESTADFAELLRQDEVAAVLFARDRQRLIERERIAEVGFAQFQREQHEIGKMLRLMKDFAGKAPVDMRAMFEDIVDDLELNPPEHPEGMYARIEATIERISPLAPNQLRQRMHEAYADLREEMEKPDPELERLRRAEELKRGQAYYRPEALLTAAFL